MNNCREILVTPRPEFATVRIDITKPPSAQIRTVVNSGRGETDSVTMTLMDAPVLSAASWLAFISILLLTFAGPVIANDLIVKLPELPGGAKIKSAVATAPLLKLDLEAKIDGLTLTFAKVLPDTAYDVRVAFSDGTILQGVDLGWYDEEPARKDAGELDKDDREQVRAIVQDVPGFYNKRDFLFLQGDHDRAVALLRLVRDKGFVNDKGGEVIWRIELWYFKNQLGGWEAVQQQNKVLRRERFSSTAARNAVEGPIRWVARLGGLRVAKGEPAKTVTIGKLEDATK